MSSSFRIRGIRLACMHCGSGAFERLHAEDDNGRRPGSSPIELSDGRDTTVFACSTCSYLHWFAESDAIEEIPGDTPCLECGVIIPGEDSACPNCGWTWTPART